MDSGPASEPHVAERAAIRAALVSAVAGGLVGGLGLLVVAAVSLYVLPQSEGLTAPLAPVLGILGAGATLMVIGASGAAAARFRDGPRAARGLRLLMIGSVMAGLPALAWVGHLMWFAWATASTAAPTPWGRAPPPTSWGSLALTAVVLGLPWPVGLLAGLTRVRGREAFAEAPAGDDAGLLRWRRRTRLLCGGLIAMAAACWSRANGYLSASTAWGPAEAVRALDQPRLNWDAASRVYELGPAAAPPLLERLERGSPGRVPLASWFGTWLDAAKPVVPGLAEAWMVSPLDSEDVLTVFERLGPNAAGIADGLLEWASRYPQFSRQAARAIRAMGAAAIPGIERYVALHPGSAETLDLALAALIEIGDERRGPGPVIRPLLAPERTVALRALVAAALTRRGTIVVEPVLVLLADPAPEVTHAAASALDALFGADAREYAVHVSTPDGRTWVERRPRCARPRDALIRAIAAAAESGLPAARAPAVRALLALAPYEREAAEALAHLWSFYPDLWPGTPGAPELPARLLPGLHSVAAVGSEALAARLAVLTAATGARDPAAPPGTAAAPDPPLPLEFPGFAALLADIASARR